MLIAVNYHYIREEFNSPYPGIFGVTPGQFRKQLELLSTIGTFVSGEQVRESIHNGTALPENSILITFDDGLAEQSEFALPVLDSMGIPALLFINTENLVDKKLSTAHQIHIISANIPLGEYFSDLENQALEMYGKKFTDEDIPRAKFNYVYDTDERARMKYLLNTILDFKEQEVIIGNLFEKYFSSQSEEIRSGLYMSEMQVRELAARSFLGTHSHKHIPMGFYDEKLIASNIEESINGIREITYGYSPYAISYPYGIREACTENVVKLAKKAGLTFGFTMERAANKDLSFALGLARFDCNDVPGGKSCKIDSKDFFNSLGNSIWYKN